MLPRLKQLIDEVGPLHSKLILLIGPPGCGKTALVTMLAEQTDSSVINLGLELGSRLSKLPSKQRRLQAGNLLREIVQERASGDLLLIDNIELLFDAALEINPLDLLRRQAHALPVVAAWPGDYREEGKRPRLGYAQIGHPEHRDYALDGVVPFFIQN